MDSDYPEEDSYSQPDDDAREYEGETDLQVNKTDEVLTTEQSQPAPRSSIDAWLEKRKKLLAKNSRYQEQVARREAAFERALEMQQRLAKERARLAKAKRQELSEESRLREEMRKQREYVRGLRAVEFAEKTRQAEQRAEETRAAIREAQEAKRRRKQQEAEWKRELVKKSREVELLRKIQEKAILHEAVDRALHESSAKQEADATSESSRTQPALQPEQPPQSQWDFGDSYGEGTFDEGGEHETKVEDSECHTSGEDNDPDNATSRPSKSKASADQKDGCAGKGRKARKLLPRWLKKKKPAVTEQAPVAPVDLFSDQTNKNPSERLLIPLGAPFTMAELIRLTAIELSAALGPAIADAAAAAHLQASASSLSNYRSKEAQLANAVSTAHSTQSITSSVQDPAPSNEPKHIFTFAELMGLRTESLKSNDRLLDISPGLSSSQRGTRRNSGVKLIASPKARSVDLVEADPAYLSLAQDDL